MFWPRTHSLIQADYEEGLRRQKNEEARKLRQQKIEEEANFSDEESSSSNAGSLTGTPNLSANVRGVCVSDVWCEGCLWE